MSERQIKLIVAYDGTEYCGFQLQNNGVSVSSRLNQCLSRIAGHPIKITGVSRTDAGVHAKGQVVTFFLRGSIPTERIALAVNGLLPDDIVVKDAVEIPLHHYCRRGVVGKHYRYVVRTGQVSDPFDHRYVWHFPCTLDPQVIAEAISYVEGEHDFKAFTAAHSGVEDFTRRVDKIKVIRRDQDWIFDFWGHGFLYKMVRSLVGYLIDAGRGFFPAGIALEALATGNRELLGYTAPAKGLTLVKIYYDQQYYLDKEEILG
ncbi:MAG: tRNA pseudouridine(38-40) synthase TruA [Bacillota bacterium]|nr:tRNA pseudouridine(38-40) synthase TruA [Bacillota bacterium]